MTDLSLIESFLISGAAAWALCLPLASFWEYRQRSKGIPKPAFSRYVLRVMSVFLGTICGSLLMGLWTGPLIGLAAGGMATWIVRSIKRRLASARGDYTPDFSEHEET